MRGLAYRSHIGAANTDVKTRMTAAIGVDSESCITVTVKNDSFVTVVRGALIRSGIKVAKVLQLKYRSLAFNLKKKINNLLL